MSKDISDNFFDKLDSGVVHINLFFCQNPLIKISKVSFLPFIGFNNLQNLTQTGFRHSLADIPLNAKLNAPIFLTEGY